MSRLKATVKVEANDHQLWTSNSKVYLQISNTEYVLIADMNDETNTRLGYVVTGQEFDDADMELSPFYGKVTLES